MKYCVGIDVSKGKSTICVVNEFGEILDPPFEVKHTLVFLLGLEKVLNKYPKEHMKILMEDTGQYNLPIYKFLKDRNYNVIIENPLKLKRIMEKEIRIIKTDRRDSIKLALCCCEIWDRLKKTDLSCDIYNQLKFLARQYVILKRNLIQTKVEFATICDYLFPGYYELIMDHNYEFAVQVFQKYYHPSIVLKEPKELFIEKIINMGDEIDRKVMARKHAERMYSAACNSVCFYDNNKYIKMMAKFTTENVIKAYEQVNKILYEIDELAKKTPEYKIVKDMPGCGDKLSTLLIAEIGDVRRFSNNKKIIAFAGIDTNPIQSGKYEVPNLHITKRGSKNLRKILYQIVSQINHHYDSSNEVKRFIMLKESEGKPKKVAKVAGMNKFLKMYYGTIKKRYKELGIW